MKRMLLSFTFLSLFVSACLPAPSTPAAGSQSEVNLQATAGILAEQTLRALPTLTVAPSNTPVVVAATSTASSTLSITETPISIPASDTASPVSASTINATLTSTATFTSGPPSISETPTAHAIFYGTLPPNLPFGKIALVNKSKADVYISLQCTTKNGYKTILEYPVHGQVNANIPAGKYVYVAWVGGNKIIGEFGLGVGDEMVVTIYKDRVRVK